MEPPVLTPDPDQKELTARTAGYMKGTSAGCDRIRRQRRACWRVSGNKRRKAVAATRGGFVRAVCLSGCESLPGMERELRYAVGIGRSSGNCTRTERQFV